MQETRRQHTVSKFYLKGFADDNDQISRIALPGEPRITLSIGDASVIKDFYSVELPTGERSDMFEQLFAQIEGPASGVLAATLGGKWPLSTEEKEQLGTWIALQQLRGEEVRAGQNHISAEFIRLVIGASGKEPLRRHIEAAEGRTVNDEELDAEWRDITKPGGPTLAPDPAEHVRTIVELAPGLAAYLRDSHWTLHRFQRRALVTCDHPVSMAQADREPWEGVGLATADIFSIPLSRRIGLTIQPRHRLEQFTTDTGSVPDFAIDGTTATANSINQQTVREARRYVYLHPADVLDARIRLPEPTTTSRMVASNIDNLISEEGLFPLQTYSGRRPQTPRDADTSDGITLADVPWPIPRRIYPAR
jgi:hypothetical protein